MKRIYPGDVANAYVRCLLADIGAELGGFSPEDWKRTLEYFDYKCAYTGNPVTFENAVMDHVIPHNRENCGLHVFGNIIPSTDEANSAKSSKDYAEFLLSDDNVLKDLSLKDRQDKIEKIRSFLDKEYMDKHKLIADLGVSLLDEYQEIKRMCETKKGYFQSKLSSSKLNKSEELFVNKATLLNEEETLSIEFDPPSLIEFKKELLKNKVAYITEYYFDNNKEPLTKKWVADSLTEKSNIIGNIRSRREYRKNEFVKNGIERLRVTIREPQGI